MCHSFLFVSGHNWTLFFLDDNDEGWSIHPFIYSFIHWFIYLFIHPIIVIYIKHILLWFLSRIKPSLTSSSLSGKFLVKQKSNSNLNMQHHHHHHHLDPVRSQHHHHSFDRNSKLNKQFKMFYDGFSSSPIPINNNHTHYFHLKFHFHFHFHFHFDFHSHLMHVQSADAALIASRLHRHQYYNYY